MPPVWGPWRDGNCHGARVDFYPYIPAPLTSFGSQGPVFFGGTLATKLNYQKQHLSYQDQVLLLKQRGLSIADEAAAQAFLERVGYYRLSAYLYPFRSLIPQGSATPYDFEYRSSSFVAGSKFEDATRLYWFDVGLRDILASALRELELHLRALLAHYVSAQEPFGHNDPAVIDTSTTKRLQNYARWDSAFTKAIRQSGRTDFMKHFTSKYKQPIPPLWMLVETLDFGGLTSLYSVINQQLQNQISNRFGIAQGSLLEDWLQNLREVRNVTAHHGRLWNARLNWKVGNPQLAHADLAHAQHLAAQKVYVSAALLFVLLRSAGIGTAHQEKFTALMKKFPTPANGVVTPQMDMGFPSHWDSLPLWT